MATILGGTPKTLWLRFHCPPQADISVPMLGPPTEETYDKMFDNTRKRVYTVLHETYLTETLALQSEVVKTLTPGMRMVALDESQLVDGSRRMNCALSMLHFQEHGHLKGFVTLTDNRNQNICELTPDPWDHDIAY